MDPLKSTVPLTNSDHATPLADIVVGLNYMRQHGVDANVLRMSKETLRLVSATQEFSNFATLGKFDHIFGRTKSPVDTAALLLREMIEQAHGYKRQFLIEIWNPIEDGKILMCSADDGNGESDGSVNLA